LQGANKGRQTPDPTPGTFGPYTPTQETPTLEDKLQAPTPGELSTLSPAVNHDPHIGGAAPANRVLEFH